MRTSCCQRSAGKSRQETSRWTAACSANARNAETLNVAPSSISRARASGEEYIGFSTPVAAQSTSLAIARAL